MDKIGRYQFLAEPFHCDFSGRLFMGHLGNHMLNAADFHSTDRGFGMHYLNTIHRTWVLSRLAIEMFEMPQQYTRFTVETWVESAMRFFTQRNFRVVTSSTSSLLPPPSSKTPHPSSITLGYGRSVWAMIDTETRQPADILAVNDGAINGWIEKDYPCPVEKGGRVRMGDNARLLRTIDTFYNDVDINGHINSVKYIEHVLDLWPIDWYRSHAIRRFEIAYVAEAHAGDSLSFYAESLSELEHNIRIVKNADTEVCRCKIQFVPL